MDTTSTSTSTSTSKIVVGVALAAVFGTGVYFYGVRGAHDSQVPPAIAAAPPPPSAMTAAAPPPPPTTGPADQVVSDEGEVAPATSNTVQNEVSTTPAESAAPAQQQTAPAPQTHHVAKRTSGSDSNTDTAANAPAQPAPAQPAVTPPPVASTTAPATGSADVAPAPAAAPAPAPAPSAQDGAAPSPSASADNGTSDSKISSDVKTEIASAAPNSNVDVTTTNGVVALTGSVPSEDAVAQAKQVAMGVQGVKTVDTSHLLVNNQ